MDWKYIKESKGNKPWIQNILQWGEKKENKVVVISRPTMKDEVVDIEVKRQ